MTYYCVHAEFYNYGAQKAFLSEKQTETKPKNRYRKTHGLQAFKIWLVSKERADELVQGIINKSLDLDDINYLFTDMTSEEVAA